VARPCAQQVPAEKRMQAAPVPLGGRPVVDAGALWKHETVLRTAVPLHPMRRATFPQCGLQLRNHARLGPFVVRGATQVHLAPQLPRQPVRRVGAVGDELGAVDRRDAGDPFRKS